MATRTSSPSATRSKARRKSPLWKRIVKNALAVAFLVSLIGGTALGVLFLLSFKRAEDRIQALFEKLDSIEAKKTTILARDGKTVLYSAAAEFRRPIEDFDEIPKHVIDATLAAEDKRFFQHDGVDPVAVLRSVFINFKEGRTAQGGSTITMQLSKELFTSKEQTFSRKIDDATIAIQMERMLTKREILRNYLNQVYYGQGAYGFKAAAEVYFGKTDLNKLSVGEAAMLARCVRRPGRENPIVDLKAATRNRDVVLRIMRDEGMISQKRFEISKQETPKLQPKRFGSGERILGYAYFTRYVLDVLKRKYPDVDFEKGGYTIETTLDPSIQDAAEREVRNLVRRNRRGGVNTAAILIMGSDGKILAMQGGLDYERNQFNVITQGRRQPGSSMKPYIYAAALADGKITPGSRISNEKMTFRDGGKFWTPQNSGGGYGGSYSIQDALGQSKNVPAVWVTDQVGPDTAALYCRDIFGFESRILPVLSMALGTNEVSMLEMARGYSVFQTGGDRVEPQAILRIIGPDNAPVYQFEPQIRKRVLDDNVANLMDRYLRYVVERGTGKEAQAIANARGKTGTTQDNKDVWFCGYTNNLITIAWAANEQREGNRWVYRPMSRSTMGGTVAVDLWRETMRTAVGKMGSGVDRDRSTSRLSRDMDVAVEPVRNDEADAERERAREEARDRARQREEEKAAQREQEKASNDGLPPVQPLEKDPPVTRPRTDDPPRRDPDPPRNRDEEMTTVEICEETGQRATMYCPATVQRRYPSSQAPRRYCRKHTPPGNQR